MRWDSMSKSIWTDEKRDKMRWVSKDEREERWEIRWVSQSRCTDEKRAEMRGDEMRWVSEYVLMRRDEMSQSRRIEERRKGERWDKSVKMDWREKKGSEEMRWEE